VRSRLKLLQFVLAWAAPLAATAATDTRALDAAIDREHAAGRFAGTVLVGQGDAVAYQRAIGIADRSTQRPHQVGDVWRWASVSKQVAAVLAMQLVEKGTLSLDAKLTTLLPAFQAPRAADITLRHLLQHTSGLPNPDARPSFYLQQFGDEGGPVTAALRYCSGPATGEPGARFNYNNCDTLVLQAVLEKATGQRYAQLVQTAVAQPLGLSTLALTPARLRPNETPVATARGYLDATREEPPMNLPSFGAGGALRGTAEDLWRFDRALMQGRLLGAEARRTLWQGEPKLGYVALGAWSFSAPLAGCAAPVALVERRGQIGGVQVRNLIAPELGAALIVFSNTAQTEFGEIWQGSGLTHELASAAFCGKPVTPGGGGAAVPPPAPAAADKPAKPVKWNVEQPPGVARTVSLDTRTGTWMSVDVSPDGQTLVFDLLGDLYLLPMAGGDARPLTTSIAWDHQARFSPDGKRIAYVTDAGGGDNVWVMNIDGTAARAVTTEDYRLLNNPVWHPSGQTILARKHYTGTRSAGSGEIWMYHLDGGKGVALNEKPNWQKDLGEPAISPDGRYVYYSRDSTPGNTFEYNKDSNKEIFRIFRIDLRDGSTEPFVQGPGGAVRPVPSPDGKHLAFVRRVRNQSTLFLKDLKTGIEKPVWGKLERDLQEAWSVYGVYPAFAWTPDSRQIVVWAQGKLWRVNPFAQPEATAAEIPFRVRHTREVREALRVPQQVSPDRFAVRQLRGAQVSPDGARVVYSALGYLVVKDLNAQGAAAEPRRLTTQTTHFENFPSLARDGRSVVYVSWNDQTQGQVRRLDIASGKDTVVTPTPGKYLAPRLSPDGRSVVYVKSRGGFLTPPWQGLDTGVYLANADGSGEPVRLTKDGDSPIFGARSDEVFVTRTTQPAETEVRRSLWRIHTVDRSENEVARGEFVSEYSVSPDGRWLGFVERFHAYVAPFPLSGKPLTVGPRMDGMPVRQLSLNAGQNLHFSGDSQRAHFSSGDQLFSVALSEAFAPAATDKPADKAAAGSAEKPAGNNDGKPAGFRPPAEGRAIGFMARSDRPTGRIAITGARVATMRGNNADEVIDNAVIVIDGHRISAIGPAGSLAIPADAQRVDASGKTIVPGFIDAHWHGGMGEDGIVPQQSWVNLASLAFGVTAIHDPSNRNDHIFTQAELQRTGQVLGPRIYSTGSVLYGAKAGITAIVNNLDDALTHLKRQQANGAISVKSYNQPRREQRQMLLEAGRQTNMMVVPEGGSMFQLNMSQIVDGHTGLEHALPIAEVYDDVTQLWQQTKVGYTPTLNVAYGGLDGEHYWYARTDVWRHPLLSLYVPPGVLQSRSVRRPTAPEEDFNVIRVARTATALQRAGVPAMIGAHGQREGLGAHWEMWMFGLGGMTPLEALRTATINPARHFGLDADLGSLEVGKLADLVIIDGDVLADIRNSDRITHVMQNGRLFEAATLSEVAIAGRARTRPRTPFFFEGADARWQAMLDAHAFCAGH
jgi:imidazolonepropionase-like amidohydrolase/CubicO group peptidase (beta-lactamase class C family)/Tol biopolymer transport system component